MQIQKTAFQRVPRRPKNPLQWSSVEDPVSVRDFSVYVNKHSTILLPKISCRTAWNSACAVAYFLPILSIFIYSVEIRCCVPLLRIHVYTAPCSVRSETSSGTKICFHWKCFSSGCFYRNLNQLRHWKHYDVIIFHHLVSVPLPTVPNPAALRLPASHLDKDSNENILFFSSPKAKQADMQKPLLKHSTAAAYFPQLRLPSFAASPPIFVTLLSLAWELFLARRYAFLVTLFTCSKNQSLFYCPFHLKERTDENTAETTPKFNTREPWVRMPLFLHNHLHDNLNVTASDCSKKQPDPAFLWRLHLAIHDRFLFLPFDALPTRLRSFSDNDSNCSFFKNLCPVVPTNTKHAQRQRYTSVTLHPGLWLDDQQIPVRAVMLLCDKTASADPHRAEAERQMLRRDIFWACRIHAKYCKRPRLRSLPIPELLAYAYGICPSSSPFNGYPKKSQLSALCRATRDAGKSTHTTSLIMIQRQVSGPTFEECIASERQCVETTHVERLMNTKTRLVHFKLLCCREALQQVLNFGLLSLRHNDLCPANFWIDKCRGDPRQPETVSFVRSLDVKLGRLHTVTKLLDTTTKYLAHTDPWFRSPELVQLIAAQQPGANAFPSANPVVGHCVSIGRTSDAWSAGLSVACFLLAQQLPLICRDLGPLQFDPTTKTWAIDVHIWTTEVCKRLLFSNVHTTCHPALLQAASSVLQHLVVPERFNRDIPNAIKTIEQLLATFSS